MTYLVSKRIKGHDYWYEVRSERKGGRVRQVHVKYLGRGGGNGRPSAGALRNLGKAQLDLMRNWDPEWAAAWDAPDTWLKFGRWEWHERVVMDQLQDRQQRAIRRWKRWMKKAHVDPLTLQEAEDLLLRNALQEEIERTRIIRKLRRAGRLKEYDGLVEARSIAAHRHFYENWKVAGMGGVMRFETAWKKAQEQTAPERQAIKDFLRAL